MHIYTRSSLGYQVSQTHCVICQQLHCWWHVHVSPLCVASAQSSVVAPWVWALLCVSCSPQQLHVMGTWHSQCSLSFSGSPAAELTVCCFGVCGVCHSQLYCDKPVQVLSCELPVLSSCAVAATVRRQACASICVGACVLVYDCALWMDLRAAVRVWCGLCD
jgi:hypothetical protein